MTRNATSRNEFRAPISQVMYCSEKHIFPVRYALTSEAHPPIWGQPIYSAHLPKLKSYTFTLRTIQKGYIFLFWKGCYNVVCYRAKDKMFMDAFENTDEGKPTITIPHGVNTIFIRYLDIPDGGRPLDPSTLKKIAENLRSENYKYMQEVRLDENVYAASVDCIASYVEEFRENTGYLSYLPCWGYNNHILKFSRKALPYMDEARRSTRWKAAACGMGEKRTDRFCSSTYLVALHDCIGNLNDCVSIHHSSHKAISYFQQWHAPLVLSSLLIDTIVERKKQKAVSQWRMERGNTHFNLALSIRDEKSLERAIRDDLAAHPCPVKINGTHRDDEAFMQRVDGVDIHAEERHMYLRMLTTEIKAVCDSLTVLAADWSALLACKERYSLSDTLLHVFKSDDQQTCPADVLSSSLTMLRGEIFCLCQMGFAGMPAYDAALDGLFEDSAVFQTLWKDVIGKGGVPQGSFSVWVYNLLPYISYRAEKFGIRDSVLAQILDTCAARLRIPSPTQNREGVTPLQALQKALMLIHPSESDESLLTYIGKLSEIDPYIALVKDGLLNILPEDSPPAPERDGNTAGQTDGGSDTRQGDVYKHQEERAQGKDEEKKTANPQKMYREQDQAILQDRQTPSLLRYTTVKEALSAATRALGIAASVGNLAVMAEEVLKASKQGDLTGGLYSLGKALPSVLALTEEFRALCLRQTIGPLFAKVVVAGGAVAAGATFLEMRDQEENALAITSKMAAELALLLLPYAAGNLPLAGILILVNILGTTIYDTCRDDDEIVFLKNTIWNRREKHALYYTALEIRDEKRFIFDDKEVKIDNNIYVPSSQIWGNVRETVGEQIAKFAFPDITIVMNEQILYVLIRSYRLYFGEKLDININIQIEYMETMTYFSPTFPQISKHYEITPTPVHEEKINTDHYMLHEIVFSRKDIFSSLRKKPTKQYKRTRCLVSIATNGLPLDQRSYTVDEDSSWLNSAPELKNRLALLTRQLAGK